MMKFIFCLFCALSSVVYADVLDESEAQDLTQVLENAKRKTPVKPEGRQVVRVNDKDNMVREIEFKEVQEIEEPVEDEELK